MGQRMAHYTDTKTGQRYVYNPTRTNIERVLNGYYGQTEAFKFRGIIFVDRGGHYECMDMAKRHFSHNGRQYDKITQIFLCNNSYGKNSGYMMLNGTFKSRGQMAAERKAEREAAIRAEKAREADKRRRYPTILKSGEKCSYQSYHGDYFYKAIMIKDVVYISPNFHWDALDHALNVLSKGSQKYRIHLASEIDNNRLEVQYGYVREERWLRRN